MDEIIFGVNDALSSSPAIALGAALVWGVFSVILSPCHLGTIPLIVGMVGSGSSSGDRGSGALLSFSFAGGMLVAIALLAAIVTTAGYAVQDLGPIMNYVIAAVFFAAGLNLMGLLPLPLPGLSIKRGKRKGALAAMAIGFLFGVGLSPCTFAFLAPILGVTFGSAATDPIRALILLLAFGLGHCGVIGLAGSSTELVQRYLDWNNHTRALTAVKIICGVLVLVAGGGLIYTA